MVTEGQGDQTPQPDDKSLVIRSEQTSLSRIAESPVLQILGFSPQFPDRLAKLNDVLGRATLPVSALEITLFPGKIPVVQTQIEPTRGYFVHLRATRSQEVTLAINHPEEPGPVGQGFTLTDIQDFVQSTFPNRSARFFVYRNLWNEVAADEDFDKDLFALSEDELKPLTIQITSFNPERGTNQVKGRAYEYHGEIRLGEQKDPLFLVYLFDRFPLEAKSEEEKKTVILHVIRFVYLANPEDVERVMEAAVKLFDKPSGYPYRWEDSHPEAEEEEE